MASGTIIVIYCVLMLPVQKQLDRGGQVVGMFEELLTVLNLLLIQHG
jgi:hypothetical protein